MSEQDIERLKERHREEVKQARDAALEEAVRACAARAKTWAKKVDEAHAKDRDDLAMEAGASACALHDQARDIRALKSQPARRYLDAETVREVLCGVRGDACTTPLERDIIGVAARRLGLGLDAPPVQPPSAHELASEENGLLPKRRKP